MKRKTDNTEDLKEMTKENIDLKKEKENTDEKVREIPVEGAETVSESPAEAQETEPEEDELEKLSRERDEFKDKWLRSMAEFENYRRNALKEKSDWIKYGNEKLLLDVCEIYDNFERAFQNEVSTHNLEAFLKGVQLIYQQMETLLKRYNVEKIDCMEKEFDPNFHEALAHIPSPLEENMISAVIQNGYKLNEKVIRPARVAVSNGVKPETNQEN